MTQTAVHPVLIAGEWRTAHAAGTFGATDPRTRQELPGRYPISTWVDIDAAMNAATAAAELMRKTPGEQIAAFLEAYAAGIEARNETLAASAARETGLALSPRLSAVEIPRTTGQLRQAAAAARTGSWRRPTIDSKAGLRSCLAPIGPVWTIGPNNFPFAYNGISGGDFAAAIAAGNPVFAKAHPLHPGTSRQLAEVAIEAANQTQLPAGAVQMIYHLSPEDGLRLAGDPRLAAIGFTGGRRAGLAIKSAADAAGRLFFGEMSSVNPVVLLPGAISENAEAIAEQLATSVLMGTGQFCTKPGIVILVAGAATEAFVATLRERLATAPAGVLFSAEGQSSLVASLNTLRSAGADLVLGGEANSDGGYSVANSILRVSAEKFVTDPKTIQTEAFGSAVVLVIAETIPQVLNVLRLLEGNLTGTIYSAKDTVDEAEYQQVHAALRPKVGRLINDKMPTGVAVSPAMNHGGPFPATTQPHFSAVGLPGSISRFTQLESYDNVREHRLPPCLRNLNPTGQLWRHVDGTWTLQNL